MQPYVSPQQIEQGPTITKWPRVIDVLSWIYPVCFAATMIGTTIYLRASSLSISPMQYDFYFEKAGTSQQFWYDIALLFLIFSPVAILVCPWLQLVWPFRPMNQRFRFVAITAATWFVSVMLIAASGVPVLDYLID